VDKKPQPISDTEATEKPKIYKIGPILWVIFGIVTLVPSLVLGIVFKNEIDMFLVGGDSMIPEIIFYAAKYSWLFGVAIILSGIVTRFAFSVWAKKEKRVSSLIIQCMIGALVFFMVLAAIYSGIVTTFLLTGLYKETREPTATQEAATEEEIDDEIQLISENFSEDPNPNIWNLDALKYCADDSSGAYSENEKALRFEMEHVAGLGEARYCYLPFRIENHIDKYDIKKISFEVLLHSGLSEGSYAGLISSCGDTDIYYFLSPTFVSYKEKYSDDKHEIYHHDEMPYIKRTLIIEWNDSGDEISLWIEEGNKPLMEPVQFPCEGFPQHIGFGIYTIQGSPVLADIDDIVIWGIENEEK
jgi:hypothetical protein